MSFYVYAYLRVDGTPYYIGKGTKNRAYIKHKTIKLPKDKTRIVILETNLEEQEAYQLEKELIAKYGRKNANTGILHNKTDGGEGGSTIANHPNREDIIRRISETNKNNNKHKRFGENNPNWGNSYIHTEETKKLISEKITGRKLSEEHIRKLKKSKNKKTVIDDMVFNSRSEAATHYNVSVSTISYWLKIGKVKEN
jgi:hypothetical protein